MSPEPAIHAPPRCTEELAAALRERILVHRRRHGHGDPAGPARRGRLPRRAVRRLGQRPAGQQRPADAHPARHHRGIHREYLEAGADIIETNTFNANAISLADYGMAGARLRAQPRGRAAGPPGPRRGQRADPGPAALRRRRARARRPAPPRSRPDVNDPGARNVTYDQLVAAYSEATRGLLDGGADLLLIETIFDTLNAKAAIFAVEPGLRGAGRRWPVVISGTITDASGRTLSGQTTEAFWNSVRHARPLLVGLNCALGAKRDAPLRRRAVPDRRRLRVRLPQRRPAQRLRRVRRGGRGDRGRRRRVRRERAGQPRRRLLRHHAGPHRAPSPRPWRGKRAARCPPRSPRRCACPGSSRSPITADSLFVNVGERTNITGSARFRKLIKDGDYDTALAVAAPAGRERRAGHRRQHGRGDDRRRSRRWTASSS